MKELSRLSKLLLFILDRAQKIKVNNLSKFQIMKLVYLIEIEAHKYADSNFSDVRFYREPHGPSSSDIYRELEYLHQKGFIDIKLKDNTEYGFHRVCHKLAKPLKEELFNQGETMFLDSVLLDYINMSQRKLKSLAYDTKPMKHITTREKDNEIIREMIDFSLVPSEG